MRPVSYSSYSAWSKVFMPRRVERDITSLILATSPLKIRSWMSGELSMISIAAMRPEPASRGTSRCEMSALMLSDRSMSSWSRRSSGKKLTTRSSAWLALLACSVASTRCPVSENWMPYSMVSRSRISPIRITSGACRSVFLSAACQESVSTPTSRCVITHPLWVCTYSTGSSMVTMCPRVLSLRYPTMVASVVDLPEPVPPTTITRPRLLKTTSLRIGGRSSSSKVGILALISRMTQPTAACCTKALTRKRPMPGGAIAKLHSLVASNSRVCRSFMMARTSVADCSTDSARSLWGRISPSILMAGGKPAVMNRSDAFFSVTRRRRSCISLMAWSRSMCVPPLLQRVLVLRLVARLFLADDALGDQVGEALVEGLHALGAAGLDGGIHLRDLALADQVTDRRGADHDLVGRDAAAGVLLHERLRDHRAQRLGQHRAHHVLLLARKHVDDAVGGLGGGAGMQRAEHQVTGLGGGER